MRQPLTSSLCCRLRLPHPVLRRAPSGGIVGLRNPASPRPVRVRGNRVFGERLRATTGNTTSSDDDFPNDDFFLDIDNIFGNLNMGDNQDAACRQHHCCCGYCHQRWTLLRPGLPGRWSPLPWRMRFVKHFVMASTGTGGFILSTQGLAASITSSSSSVSSPLPADVLSLPSVGWTFASTFTALLSPIVFRDDTPVVVTRNRSYAACNMPAFLAAAGLPPYSVQLETQALPVALNLGAPVVPVTCVNGGGVPTPEMLVLRDGGGNAPEVVYGDGDGVVNLPSILALDEVIGGGPRQEYYKFVRIANMSHLGVVSDSTALQRLIGEILVATRAVDTRVM
ncbi:hypothetical protein QYE76_069083 [Lolium multiflorum]|uniref:Uncharacterized protein n=1 Tax=Lolium multiflorum TaxID=4521 RepID=A0AAD8SGQ3_LOLMU|nr:hypothetical protein QYE76_069083 [Lolium multiflorum]